MAVARHRHLYHLRHTPDVAHCRCRGQCHWRDESLVYRRFATGHPRGSRGGPKAVSSCLPSKETILANASHGEATLTLGGASQAAAAGPPALPSPDGLWRGTFACSASIGSFGSETQAFTINLELRLANGSGSWKPQHLSSKRQHLRSDEFRWDPTGVSVTGFYSQFKPVRRAFRDNTRQHHSRDRKGGT